MMIQAKNIFIVGIKGVAMANLALIMKKMGKFVSGSDTDELYLTDEILKKNNIHYSVGFDPMQLPNNCDLVIYSASHKGSENPQILEAKKKNIKIASQAQILSELLDQFENKIAVCGTHGKTTTASLLAFALENLGQNPSYLVGTVKFDSMFGAQLKAKKYFVIEADEYAVDPPSDKTPKFHHLNPSLILCTNIDFDHPDVYKNVNDTKDAFIKFFANRRLILCADDPTLLQSFKRFKRNRYETYGFSNQADLQITHSHVYETHSTFNLEYKGRKLGSFDIFLFGQKNISNATGAVLLLFQLGFKTEDIKSAIRNFTGAQRRFEKIAYLNNTYLFDDYAHHPREIEATINAARARFPKRRIIVLFQPHTFSRTRSLLEEFIRSLSLADYSLVLPIFPSARENPAQFDITNNTLINRAKTLGIKNLLTISKIQLQTHLLQILKKKDAIITMGAGDVYKLKDDIIKIIKSL